MAMTTEPSTGYVVLLVERPSLAQRAERAFRAMAEASQSAAVALNGLSESFEKLRAAFRLYTRAELKRIIRTGTKSERMRAYALLVRQRVE